MKIQKCDDCGSIRDVRFLRNLGVCLCDFCEIDVRASIYAKNAMEMEAAGYPEGYAGETLETVEG